jgi:hypothetical protein
MPREIVSSLNLDFSAPRQARELLEPFRADVDERVFHAIRQVVTELVSQCVRDAATGDLIEVSAHTDGLGVVEVAVSRPSRRSYPETRDGRDQAARIAFDLVEYLVDTWGVREDDQRVAVWVRLRPPRDGSL